jgi:predicted  nucleic acid-binding Zn ribbon protein
MTQLQFFADLIHWDKNYDASGCWRMNGLECLVREQQACAHVQLSDIVDLSKLTVARLKALAKDMQQELCWAQSRIGAASDAFVAACARCCGVVNVVSVV